MDDIIENEANSSSEVSEIDEETEICEEENGKSLHESEEEDINASKDVNDENSDKNEGEDESHEIEEVSGFWRLYEVTKCYYLYFTVNFERILEDVTLWLVNFHLGYHRL